MILTAAGLILGAAAGYAYWFYVGCNSGTCLITSKASNSSFYGLAMGGLLTGSIWDFVNKKNDK